MWMPMNLTGSGNVDLDLCHHMTSLDYNDMQYMEMI